MDLGIKGKAAVVTGGSSSTTTCSASLTGLGGGDLVIVVTVRGEAVYQCQNGGGNTAPGQNRVLVGPVTAPTTIPGDQIKNGNVSFTTAPATLTAPPTVSGAAACPNPWATLILQCHSALEYGWALIWVSMTAAST